MWKRKLTALQNCQNTEMTLGSGSTDIDYILHPPKQVGGHIQPVLIRLLNQWEITSHIELLNCGVFHCCSSYSEPNIDHKIPLCLPIVVFLFPHGTPYTHIFFVVVPGYNEVVKLIVCHLGVAILLLKYCIMQQDLQHLAEHIIKVTLLTFLLVAELWSACSNL